MACNACSDEYPCDWCVIAGNDKPMNQDTTETRESQELSKTIAKIESQELKWKLPLTYDGNSTMVFDADGRNVLDIRGWGYLTGVGGLHLEEHDAAKIQDARAAYIVNAVNQHEALAASHARQAEVIRVLEQRNNELLIKLDDARKTMRETARGIRGIRHGDSAYSFTFVLIKFKGGNVWPTSNGKFSAACTPEGKIRPLVKGGFDTIEQAAAWIESQEDK